MSTPSKPRFMICVNTIGSPSKPCCAQRGSIDLADKIEAGVAERDIDIKITRIVCLGRCRRGPNMRIAPGGAFFSDVDESRIPEILDALEAAAAEVAPSAEGGTVEIPDDAYPGG